MSQSICEVIQCDPLQTPRSSCQREGQPAMNVATGGEMVVYTIAKTALVGFTRAQAIERAPYGVQVNGIALGIW